jgi:hypothetical protein
MQSTRQADANRLSLLAFTDAISGGVEMGKPLRKGSKVEWKWGANTAHGKIAERFTSKVTRTIKGTEVTRNATQREPAYLIKQEDGDQVLKSRSELHLG